MRSFLLLIVAIAGLRSSRADAQATEAPKHYVIVHGAWGGGWDWRGIDSLLTKRGHVVDRVTLTGLGDRMHLAHANIGLDTHVTDVVNTIAFEKLRDVVLVGHSYGGMVITGVAERIPDRIRHLVYIDAFLPQHGESVRTLSGENFDTWLARMSRNGMLVPPWASDTLPPPRDVPHPQRTFTDTLVLTSAAARRIPGTYILTIDTGQTQDSFSPYAVRAEARGWRVFRMENTDHVPERSAPLALVSLLRGVP